jgi:acyl-CoA synthetase (AMP-forming)/AMP-acid ligase II
LHAFAAAARLEHEMGVTVLAERAGGQDQFASYRALYHTARRVAAGLHDLGVAPGDRVLLVLPTSLHFIHAFFGAQLLHAVPVPAYPPNAFRLDSSLQRMAHIAEHAGARVCVTWAEARPILGELALRAPRLERIVTIEELVESAPMAAKFRASPADLAFIQYTSGSAGRPKGVALRHWNLVCNLHGMGEGLHLSRGDVVVSWLPLYHDMGLIGVLLMCFYWRLPLTLMSPTAFIADPLRWLRTMSATRATITVAPNFGYAMCSKRAQRTPIEGLDLSRWRLAITGAEQVNPATIDGFVQTFAPVGLRPSVFLPVYGLAETALAATFTFPGDMVRRDVVLRRALAVGLATPASRDQAGTVTLIAVGRPLSGHEVRVIDEDGSELPDREVGEIVVRGPSVMSGYFEDERATSAAVQDGWLRTGDLGYFAEGDLFVTGRAKDVIIVHGEKYFAEDIEASLEGLDGVRPGGCVAFGVYDEDQAQDRVVIVLETKVEGGEARAALTKNVRDLVLQAYGVRVDEVFLAKPGWVPKTSSGKRQRSLCRANYLAQRFAPERTGKLKQALVAARAQAGFVRLWARRKRRTSRSGV